MDAQTVIVLADGVEVPADAPVVGALDPGILGQGVYESIRTYAGIPFAVEAHLERLAHGAQALEILCPLDLLSAETAQAVALLRATGHPGEARIRLYLTAGGRRIVVCDALPDRAADREHGLRACTLPWPRATGGPTEGVKASSTAAVRIAARHVRRELADTGLWLTPDGMVSEALTANVFAVVAGRLVTPPLSDGALPGVTRSKILRWAAEYGIAVAEERLPLAALADAPEAFLSATSEPVVPLVVLDAQPIGGRERGPVTLRLQSLFEQRARELCRAQAAAPSPPG